MPASGCALRGAPDRIVYVGSLDSDGKTGAFADADIFCFPSLNEAFPLTILEAMSAGVPVAALVTTCTKDYDRISMHGVRRSLLHQQAESLGIPLHEVFIAVGAMLLLAAAQMRQGGMTGRWLRSMQDRFQR